MYIIFTKEQILFLPEFREISKSGKQRQKAIRYMHVSYL